MVRPGTVILLSWMVLGTGCFLPEDPKATGTEEAAVSYTGATKLLTPAALEELRTSDKAPFIVDVRPMSAHEQGHIPGSVQLWRDAFTRTDLPYEGMAINRPAMEQLLDSLGLRPDQLVVAYDDRASCEAARFWWIMQLYGHPNVVILDGGIGHWRSKGLPIEHTQVTLLPSGYTFPQATDSSLAATMSDVKNMIASGKGLLLDSRSIEEHLGTDRPGGPHAPSTIPGSVHYDWINNVDMDADQCLKRTAEIVQQLSALGIHPDDTVITYCRSGVRSAHATFVMTQVLGMQHVRNYDGSWAEWSHFIEPSVAPVSSTTTPLP